MTENRIVAECWTCDPDLDLSISTPKPLMTDYDTDLHRAAGHDVRPVAQTPT